LPSRGKFLPFFPFSPKDLPLNPDLLIVRGKKLPHLKKSGNSSPPERKGCRKKY
jgi:hypothetical protein